MALSIAYVLYVSQSYVAVAKVIANFRQSYAKIGKIY